GDHVLDECAGGSVHGASQLVFALSLDIDLLLAGVEGHADHCRKRPFQLALGPADVDLLSGEVDFDRPGHADRLFSDSRHRTPSRLVNRADQFAAQLMLAALPVAHDPAARRHDRDTHAIEHPRYFVPAHVLAAAGLGLALDLTQQDLSAGAVFQVDPQDA